MLYPAFTLHATSYYTPVSMFVERRIFMRTTASFLVSKLRLICSSTGRWVGTMTPRKQTIDNASEAHIEKEKAEPIAAFSRPPPLYPFLGPLVALSMLESWNKQDNNDD